MSKAIEIFCERIRSGAFDRERKARQAVDNAAPCLLAACEAALADFDSVPEVKAELETNTPKWYCMMRDAVKMAKHNGDVK